VYTSGIRDADFAIKVIIVINSSSLLSRFIVGATVLKWSTHSTATGQWRQGGRLIVGLIPAAAAMEMTG